MKEITREISIRMTIIETMTDEDAEDIEKAREDAEKNIKRDMERIYKPDNIKVELKDFVTDYKAGAEDDEGIFSRIKQ